MDAAGLTAHQLLRHAFIRVGSFNSSRRHPAHQHSIRSHMITASGRIHDTVPWRSDETALENCFVSADRPLGNLTTSQL